MRPFLYDRASVPGPATSALSAGLSETPVQGRLAAEYLAGGTTLLDLMKLDVMQPTRLVDVTPLARDHGNIVVATDGLQLGAFATMAAVAANPGVLRDYPMVAQSLQLAASAQIRNMASLGGNVLQRTRCSYFRDAAWANCNKRTPGSGCAALGGVNRAHAILGTTDHCIATYHGDWAQALIALDATVQVYASAGHVRSIPFAALHRLPGDTPHLETSLAPGELILGFTVPAAPWMRRSLYLKIRDRQSYEFALASAAVALDMDGPAVRQARIALGGVASVPWRAREAEAALSGRILDEDSTAEAAQIAFADAVPRTNNGFKIELGRETLIRALLQAATLEI